MMQTKTKVPDTFDADKDKSTRRLCCRQRQKYPTPLMQTKTKVPDAFDADKDKSSELILIIKRIMNTFDYCIVELPCYGIHVHINSHGRKVPRDPDHTGCLSDRSYGSSYMSPCSLCTGEIEEQKFVQTTLEKATDKVVKKMKANNLFLEWCGLEHMFHSSRMPKWKHERQRNRSIQDVLSYKILKRALHATGENRLLNVRHNVECSIGQLGVADEVESLFLPKIRRALTGSHSLCETDVPSTEKQRMFEEFIVGQFRDKLKDLVTVTISDCRLDCINFMFFRENSLRLHSGEIGIHSLKPDRKVVTDREMRKNEIHKSYQWLRMVDSAVSREDNADFLDPFESDTKLSARKERMFESSFHIVIFLCRSTISGVSRLLQHGTLKTLLFASLLSFASAERADENVRMWRLHWLPHCINCSDTGCPNIPVYDTNPWHSNTMAHLFIYEDFIFPSNRTSMTYATINHLYQQILCLTTEYRQLETNGTVFGQEGYEDCGLSLILDCQCLQAYLKRNGESALSYITDHTMATYCTGHLTIAVKGGRYALLSAMFEHEETMLMMSVFKELIDTLDVNTNKYGICTRRSDSSNSCQSVEYLQDVSVEGCSRIKISRPLFCLLTTINANQSKKFRHWKIIWTTHPWFTRCYSNHSQYQGFRDVIQQLLYEENSYRNRFHIATEVDNNTNSYTSVNYNTARGPEEDILLQSMILYACISAFMLMYLRSKHCFATFEGSFHGLKCVNPVVWILCTLYANCATCTSDLMLLRCKNILQLLMKTCNNSIKYVRYDCHLVVPTGVEQCDASSLPFSIQEHCSEERSSDARVIEAPNYLCRKAKLSDEEDILPSASPSPNNAEQDVEEYQSLQGKPPVHNKDIEYEIKLQQHQQLIDDASGTETEVTCTADIKLSISGDFRIVQIHEIVERKPYILSKDEEIVFEAAIPQAAKDEELEALEIEVEQKKDYNELDHGLFDRQDRWVNSTECHNDEHQSCGVEKYKSRPYNDVDSHEEHITDLYDRPDEVEIRDTNQPSNSEVISTDDTHYVTEIGKGTAGELDISVLIPDAKLGASRPLTTNEELNITEAYHAKPSKPMQKTPMLRVKVVPPQNFTQQSDVTSIQYQAHSKSRKRIHVHNNDTFMNLKYKVKKGSYRPVDCTVEEGEFETIAAIRNCTWLPLNELPVPKIEITVAHIPQFEPLMAIIEQISNGTPPTPHISMRYELLRFCTLRSYPKEDKPFVIKLAAAGFYYASDGDGVVCYTCGVRRYNWTAEDNPMKIHKRINPNCKFLIKNEEVNIPVQYFGALSESLTYIDNIPEPIERQELSEDVSNEWVPERVRSPAPMPQNKQIEAATNSLGISTAIPKHSQYATKTAREASYNGWPDSSSHTPQELADSGYFYAGFGDCVRCFYCGIGLRHWTKEDNPWIEHARWSRNCVFLKQKKGEEFINLVQMAVQYSQDEDNPWIEHARWSRNCVFLKQKKGEEFINLVQMAVQYSQDNEAQSNASAGNQLPAQEIEKILLSDAAQSVLEMGYQPRLIKNAIEKILRQNGRSKISAQMLMEKVLEIEEAENLTNAAPAATASSPTMPAPQSAKAEAQSAKRAESKSATGGQSTAKIDKVKKDEKGAKSSVSNNDKDNKEPKAKAASKPSKELSDEAKLQDPKSVKAENEQLKEQTLCKVCLDNTVCIVFLPCGHLVTCADCAPAMRKCPICRALVKGTVRTYMS